MKSIVTLGLMCGTSVDAIDVAWLKTDGEHALQFGSTLSLPITESARAIIKAAMVEAKDIAHRNDRPPLMDQAEELVDDLHMQAVAAFAQQFPAEFAQVELIGYHGQTVFHAPEHDMTVQLGQGNALAKRFKIPVVYDFRAADVAAGGQGAPLVPIFHQALAQHFNLPSPCVFVNIGGVANVTFIDFHAHLRGGQSPSGSLRSYNSFTLQAFDCGPGNALIDDAMLHMYQQHYDDGGAIALSGAINQTLIAHLLDHQFFSESPPKSLDRNAFNAASLQRNSAIFASMSNVDVITTLTEFTVQGIVKAADYFPEMPKLWIIAGGGVRNDYIMQRLQASLRAPVLPAAIHTISEEFLEAQAFAYLAVRAKKGLPITFPSTTCVPNPLTGGVYVPV